MFVQWNSVTSLDQVGKSGSTSIVIRKVAMVFSPVRLLVRRNDLNTPFAREMQ
jgi:hypothetical protein